MKLYRVELEIVMAVMVDSPEEAESIAEAHAREEDGEAVGAFEEGRITA